MLRLFLKSTGQEVQNFNAAVPKALQRRTEGYTTILIRAARPGDKHSIQKVRNSKLQRVRT